MKKDYRCDCHSWKSSAGGTSCIYFLAFIGACVYYIQTANSFWGGVLGVLKAVVWPAILIYKILNFLGAV